MFSWVACACVWVRGSHPVLRDQERARREDKDAGTADVEARDGTDGGTGMTAALRGYLFGSCRGSGHGQLQDAKWFSPSIA